MKDVLERWGLTADGAPSAAGRFHVSFVRRGGQPLVLKAIGYGDEKRMAEVLGHWDGRGAVRVVEAAPDVILIERAMPGRELHDLTLQGRDDEGTAIFCDVAAQLHSRPAPAGFRTVEDWGQGFARNRAGALAAGMSARSIDRAEALFHDLCASQGPRVLLHGDLHHRNIVEDAARGWLAIDPKGIVGEAAYEAGSWLRNPVADFRAWTAPASVERRVAIICERLGFERERLLAWHFAQAVLSSMWGVEDGDYDPAWDEVATAAETLL